MTKKEKQKFHDFREVLLREINISESMMKSYKKDNASKEIFWDGANVQAKEILDMFDEYFNLSMGKKEE